MHGNRRYVKLAWIGLASGLALATLPSPARAEIVAPTAGRGFLAVAPDGTPRVAFLSGRDVVIARRGSSGWTFPGVGRVPPGKAVIAGLVVDEQGRTSVLLEAEDGAGLALDAAARPALAYALRLASGKTYLRLVRTDARGRLRTSPVTKKGFPSSAEAPGAVPVLVQGRLHVVETFTSAAIDWQPQRNGGWLGQYLFASGIGSPVGRIAAAASGASLWSAWTQVSSNAISVLLTLSAKTQETNVVLEHGIFVSLLLDAGRPEVGASDWVQIGDSFAYAGVLADESGPFAEVDGRLDGYTSAPAGRRQLLLSTDVGLQWFEAPARPSIRVSLSADASGRLTGRVEGATGALVQLYREKPTGPRAYVANAELVADGSFSAQDEPPASPTFYRAVYVDNATAIPYASLLR